MGIRIGMKWSIVLAVLFTTLIVQDASAQSRRKQKKLDEERKERMRQHPDRRPQERAREPRREEPKPKPKKKFEVEYPRTTMKDVYRIDILVPLYLDELVKNNKPAYKGKVPEKAASGLDFYQGISLAVDTLNYKGYKLDVHVHDITGATGNIKALIAKGTLDSSDLIIGAVQSSDIAPVAAIAEKRNINFISALSPSDAGVTNNPFFTLIQPRLQTHCEWIMRKIAEKYHKEQITVLYRTTVPADENAFSYITNILEENNLRKVNCSKEPDSAQLAKAFDSTELNVVIMPVVDDKYAESLIKRLYAYFPGYKFAVYGMPSWKTMSGIRKPESFPNVAVYFTAPFYFDPTTSGSMLLYTSYQNKFNGKPGEMVYRGFETLYWYATLLRDHGTVFNPEMKNNDKAPFTKFEIKTNIDKKKEVVLFNENQHLYLYRYQSSSYMIEQ
jgi:ABC-type branched-subunit amino acid transport system substrate-binding protein